MLMSSCTGDQQPTDTAMEQVLLERSGVEQPTDTAMEQVLLERSGVGQPDAPERANSAFGVREEDWQRCLIALESLT